MLDVAGHPGGKTWPPTAQIVPPNVGQGHAEDFDGAAAPFPTTDPPNPAFLCSILTIARRPAPLHRFFRCSQRKLQCIRCIQSHISSP